MLRKSLNSVFQTESLHLPQEGGISHSDPTLIHHMLTVAGVLSRLACVILSLLFRPRRDP